MQVKALTPRLSVATLGILMQGISFAILMPIYLAMHLFTSPTVSGTKLATLFIDPVELKALPFSIVIAYIVPSILMCLPAPSIVTFDQKQWLYVFWEDWPMWTCLAQFIRTQSMRQLSSSDKSSSTFFEISAGYTHLDSRALPLFTSPPGRSPSPRLFSQGYMLQPTFWCCIHCASSSTNSRFLRPRSLPLGKVPSGSCSGIFS